MTQRNCLENRWTAERGSEPSDLLDILHGELQHTGTRRKNECPAPLLRALAVLCGERANEAAQDRDGSRPTGEEMRWLRWRSWLHDLADRIEQDLPTGSASAREPEPPPVSAVSSPHWRPAPLRLTAG